jgi:hypothetical protein
MKPPPKICNNCNLSELLRLKELDNKILTDLVEIQKKYIALLEGKEYSPLKVTYKKTP